MVYSKVCHTVYRHRYDVWMAKYRCDVLRGRLRLRIREIIRQTCAELDLSLIKGVLSKDHINMFITVPPQHALSDNTDGVMCRYLDNHVTEPAGVIR